MVKLVKYKKNITLNCAFKYQYSPNGSFIHRGGFRGGTLGARLPVRPYMLDTKINLRPRFSLIIYTVAPPGFNIFWIRARYRIIAFQKQGFFVLSVGACPYITG